MKTIHLFDNAEEAVPVEAGTTLFEQDSYADLMYALIEGKLAIIRDNQVLTTIEAGGLVGEMAILEHRPHYASAIAQTPCRVVPITQERFRFLIEETPNFAMDMMKIMAERLHQMDQMIIG